ncbi:MAG TPA: YdcF family protein [Gammaproteobacteria bacterium]|nr:YdcF family protein [Gammaproteobacteria bacterium]
MSFYLVKIIQALLMPPALMIIIILAGLILLRWSQRYGKILIISGIFLLLVASLPVISNSLVSTMENIPALNKEQIKNSGAKAIIILGGGSYLGAPEYGGDTVSTASLERIRYGAYIHKQNDLPILVTGGRVLDYIKTPEATLMARVLKNDFHTPVKWREDQARNTWENAQYSYRMLAREKIKKIILVTHALHMPRALMSFEAAGFEVIPAPLSFHQSGNDIHIFDILPQAASMEVTYNMLHEFIGTLWYRLHYM